MALNENIIAACLDGKITKAEAAELLGGLSAEDNMIIDEAALDNDTILNIAEGTYYQNFDDELTPLDEFQLTDLPIIAQEVDESEDAEGFNDNETANFGGDFDYDDTSDITVADEYDDTPDDTTDVFIDYAADDMNYPDIDSVPDIT